MYHEHIIAENMESPAAAKARVKALRAAGVHAWRGAWREPTYGSEWGQLLTIVYHTALVWDNAE